MWLILVFVVGLIVGVITASTMLRSRAVGSLRIETSDPDDNPYLFLELSKDVSVIYKKRYVTLRVNTQNFISHN